MSRRSFWCFVLLTALAASAAAVPVEVTVSLKGGPAEMEELANGELDAVIEAIPAAESEEMALTKKLRRLPGTTGLDLEADRAWTLRVVADGFWTPDHTVLVTDSTTALELPIWPTGQIEGQVALAAAGTPSPEALVARFQSTPPKPGKTMAFPISMGKAICPIREGQWRCEIPADRLDIRLRADGFVSHYRWNVAIQPGATKQLGTLELQPGASVAGWVEIAGEGELHQCKVELVPQTAAAIVHDDQREQIRRRGFVTGVDKRGFFHFEAIAPGGYRAEASLEGFLGGTRFVQVYPRTETALTDPLRLERPTQAEVFVDPPLDPTGAPWKLRLKDARFLPSSVETVAEGRANASGSWKVEGLAPGPHLLAVIDSLGSGWYHELIEISPRGSLQIVDLDIVHLVGTIELGGEPLAAEVTFGDGLGGQPITLITDAEGRFEGRLPREGTWEVRIQSEDPKVTRTLPDVEVTTKEGTDRAEVNLSLPNATVSGIVVDETGRVLERALVNVELPESDEPRYQSFVDQDGSFEFAGLPEGRIVVNAEAPGPRVSDDYHVAIADTVELEDLEIVVRKGLRVDGRVTHDGDPVPGAQVRVYPMQDLYIDSASHVTDADGRFDFFAPQGTRGVLVVALAAGYALTSGRVPLDPGRGLAIELDQIGGTLHLELPEDAPSAVARIGARVVHDGAFLSLQMLAGWKALQEGLPETRIWSIPMMEPGRYFFCRTSPRGRDIAFRADSSPDCTGGYLPGLGELTLSLPTEKDASD